MDLLSIPNYYMEKGRPHGHRYGKKPGDREYYIANSLKKKCKKKSTWVSTTDSFDPMWKLHLKCRENTVKTYVKNGYEKRVR